MAGVTSATGSCRGGDLLRRQEAAARDLAMHDLPAGADVDSNLQADATLRPHDLALQAPGDARLVEDLQAIGGTIDMEMKALAASVTGDIQEEVVPHSRRWCCGSTAEQASKESTHNDPQRACNLFGSVAEVFAGPFYVPCCDCQASSMWWLARAMCRGTV